MQNKKLVAPIVITVLLLSCLLGYLSLFALIPFPVIVKVIFAVVLIGLIGVSLFVMYERIMEIRSGEEDDLSEY